MSDDKKLKIEFLPGAFDNFEGTQEELDEMMAELTKSVEDGSFIEESFEIDMALLAEEDPELFEILSKRLSELDLPSDRKLN